MVELKPATSSEKIIYLIYDGECLICNACAQAIRIKKAVGQLVTINARESHPLVTEARHLGYDLNEGILVKFNEKYYYGSDAVHVLALLGSPVNWFNKINVLVFRHKILTAVFYPIFKFIRKILLFSRRTPKIQPNAVSMDRIIFGEISLAKPLQLRYSNRTYSQDEVVLKGNLSVKISKILKPFSSLLRWAHVLIPYEGNMPTEVRLISDLHSNKIRMTRTVYLQGKEYYQFSSYLLVKKNYVIEMIKWRFGWKAVLEFSNGDRVIARHHSYVIELFNLYIPIPISFLIGKVYTEEVAVSETEFQMQMKMTHWLFGEIYEYTGLFKIEKLICREKS